MTGVIILGWFNCLIVWVLLGLELSWVGMDSCSTNICGSTVSYWIRVIVVPFGGYETFNNCLGFGPGPQGRSRFASLLVRDLRVERGVLVKGPFSITILLTTLFAPTYVSGRVFGVGVLWNINGTWGFLLDKSTPEDAMFIGNYECTLLPMYGVDELLRVHGN